MFNRVAASAALALILSSLSSPVDAAPINLVDNGDFSSGLSGFSTQYTYSPGQDGGWNPGVFSVEASGYPWHALFLDVGDHTTGTGNMFVANGRETPDTVWEKTITGLSTNTTYFFEAFLMNLCCTDHPRPGPSLSFFADGQMIGSGSTETPGLWTGVSTGWNSGASTSVTLRLDNASQVFDGNDFALDDVYFGTETSLPPVPEPGTMVLMGTGLAALVRRRLRKTPC